MIAAAVEVKGPARDLHSGNEGGECMSGKNHTQESIILGGAHCL